MRVFQALSIMLTFGLLIVAILSYHKNRPPFSLNN
ncbi:putative holin-like toxin [Pseudalkalibacillus sp. A8]